MKRIVWMFLALALTIGLSQVSQAEEGAKKGKGGKSVFAKLDTNGDGKLSEDEFTADKPDKEKAKKRFARLDADKDGSVTKEEMKAANANKDGGGKKKKQD